MFSRTKIREKIKEIEKSLEIICPNDPVIIQLNIELLKLKLQYNEFTIRGLRG